MSKPLAVLIVEDSESDAEIIVRLLTKADYAVVYERVETAELMRAALAKRTWDIAISDYNLPQFDGSAALAVLQATGQDIPFIAVSGEMGEETAVAMMRAGAHDYLMKGHLSRLVPSVERELANAKARGEHRRAEVKVRASEERHRSILQTAMDGVWLVDLQGRLLEVNDAYCQMSGYSAPELLAMRIPDLEADQTAELIAASIQKVKAEGEASFETRHRRKDGSLIDLALGIQYRPAEGGQFVVFLHDITARKQAAMALRESANQYRELFESASDALLLIASDTGQVMDANNMASVLYGYERDELLARKNVDLSAEPEETISRTHESQSKPGQVFNIPLRLHRKKDGTVFPVEITARTLIRKGQSILLVACRDITERKRAEEERQQLLAQLLQAQKLESIGTLAGGVAHEINNPIMGIMNYAQLILDRLGPDSPVSEFATEIGKETERVATIVKNLLSFARHEKQSHSPARMHDIVEATLSLIRAVMRHDQVTLEVDVPEDLPQIKCRSQQIQQVIMNLLTNARDALNQRHPGHDANKKVLITARRIERDGRQWVRTTVEDHGPGIPEDLRERIFEPFFTTKPRDKGTGLGLSISHGIVKDHGGELRVESTVGEFTRFHIDLPLDNGWHLENGEGGTRNAESGIKGATS